MPNCHATLAKRISEKNLALALLGKQIVAFSIGSLYHIQLVRYGYFILIPALTNMFNVKT